MPKTYQDRRLDHIERTVIAISRQLRDLATSLSPLVPHLGAIEEALLDLLARQGLGRKAGQRASRRIRRLRSR